MSKKQFLLKLTLASVAFTTITSTLPLETLKENSAEAATRKLTYKAYGSPTVKYVSVAQQKSQAKAAAVVNTLISLPIGGAPGLAGKVGTGFISLVGLSEIFGYIDSPPKYVPLKIVSQNYRPTQKMTTADKMNGTAAGYYLITVYNSKTGKKIGTSDKWYVTRAGLQKGK